MNRTGTWSRNGSTLVLALDDAPHVFEVGAPKEGPAGAIGAAIEGVGLVRDFFSTGGVKLDAYSGQHAPYAPPPGIKQPIPCVRWMRFATFDSPPLGPPARTNSFLFRIESEYDGRNLHRLSVSPEVRGTSNLSKSTFELHFDPRPIKDDSKQRAGIRLHIRGKYEKWGLPSRDSGVRGALEVWADGSSSLTLTSDDNMVRADPLSGICPPLVLPVPRKRPPRLPAVTTYGLTVFFAPAGSAKLRPVDVDRIARWYLGQNPVDKTDPRIKSLPAGVRLRLRDKKVQILLEGRASTTQGSEKNLALSRARMLAVKKILQSLSDLPDTAFVATASGEFKAKTKDGVEDARERRVKISVIDVDV
jgi:hypothetical protein